MNLSASLLSWLRCFEAAARHLSFTRAAAELCITQGAVSQQVKQLEQWLGQPLFLRQPRGLLLSANGERLRAVLGESFAAIDSCLGLLRQDPVGPLVLSCSPSFAMGWLTPRLGDFFRAHPGVGLRVYGEFHPLDHRRMQAEGIAAAVRFDLGHYLDLAARAFLDEWLLPVASPAFVAAHPELRGPENLRGSLLLHDQSPWAGAAPFAEWQHWLSAVGAPCGDLEQGQSFNLAQLALAAALAGQGVALGRSALVLEDIAAGRLVDLFGLCVQSPARYHFICPPQAHAATAQVGDWLAASGAAFQRQRSQLLAAPGPTTAVVLQ